MALLELEKLEPGSAASSVASAPSVVDFDSYAYLPHPTDNCAIATKVVPRGTRIRLNSCRFPAAASSEQIELSYSVLEGHRFVVKAVKREERLTSWGMPFAVALRDLAAGEALHNIKLITALHTREASIDYPAEPNMVAYITEFDLGTCKLAFPDQIKPPIGEEWKKV